MNNIITNIFESFGYHHIENSKLKLFKSQSIDDYWLVYTGAPKIFSHEFQSELLNQCKHVCKDRSLDKNLNLLCLWQVDNIDHSTISELHYLEEDIHYFKKHVLYFTSNEHKSFEKELEVESINELFTNYPINSNVFSRYKSNVNNDSWESLLYRICIKLTFMPISCHKGEDITNLYSAHQANLESNPYLSILDEVIQDLDDKHLADSPENLLTLISSSMAGKI
ncbi:MAG: hypothetical protein ACJAXS_002540 [Colwellia sp.]|jgi:hypothetical protein